MAKTHLLVILDGFGYREETAYNAIAQANTPNWDYLWHNYPHTLIQGSGEYVGLPDGQMGNSEVGHLNIGAGRIVYQDISRISRDIDEGGFFNNPVLTTAIDSAKQNQKALHIMGLLSPGGVHSHEDHIHAAVKLAAQRGLEKIYIHAFLDGRDTPPKSAKASLEKLEQLISDLGVGEIVSVLGRYYAMDRDQRWERVKKTYDLLVHGQSEQHAVTSVEALQLAYDDGESDEFVSATSIYPNGQGPRCISSGDSIIFMNFRADRARQLTRVFTEDSFAEFELGSKPDIAHFVTLTEYDSSLQAEVAYGPVSLDNVLGKFLSDHGLRQLHASETEKYAHVTFFFNGGEESPFENEDRILVPSPKVSTYDVQPEMNAAQLTKELTAAITRGEYDVIITNFPNPDMVGHTGNFAATKKAIETIDGCLGELYQVAKNHGAEMLITADHGNAELMFDEQTKQPHTAHTCCPVPLLYIGRPGSFTRTDGALSDIAPTLLSIMGYEPPKEMTGNVLLTLDETSNG